jgi:hypothetical protein
MKNESGSKLVHGKTPTNVHIGSKSDEEILKGNNQENFDLSPSPDDPMVNIINNEFAKSVSNNTKEASKTTKIVDISVSGPFQNMRSEFTYWSVIYGDQEAWFLKSNFMTGFVKFVLTSLKFEEIRPLLCNGIRYLVIRPSVPISYVLAERVEYIKDTFGRARHPKLARRAGRTSRTPCSLVSRLHA